MTAERYTPSTAAAIMLLQTLTAQLKTGAFHVERLVVGDAEVLELHVIAARLGEGEGEGVAASSPDVSPPTPPLPAAQSRTICVNCGAPDPTDCGVIRLPGGARVLDLMCLRCNARWQLPEE